jgi:hypothetical protein
MPGKKKSEEDVPGWPPPPGTNNAVSTDSSAKTFFKHHLTQKDSVLYDKSCSRNHSANDEGNIMGYTHYYTKTGTSTEDARLFEMFMNGARTIIEYATTVDKIQLADGMGNNLGGWECTKEDVWFNGYGPDSHETFNWSLDSSGFGFTKTARKPYDAVVTACLIHLYDVYGDLVSIGSDGSWSEWSDGARLYRNATGLTAKPPFAVGLETV